MKFALALLSLCVAQTAAFSIQGPSMPSSSALKAIPGRQQEVIAPVSRPYSSEKTWNNASGSTQASNMGNAMAQANTAPASSTVPENVWDAMTPVIVQGGSLRTWSFSNPAVRRVKVSMKTEGRPMNANVDLWQGPDNAPQKMSVYIEDGSVRPFSCVVETPRGHNAIALRNTGHMEFPLIAAVEADMTDEGVGEIMRSLADTSTPEVVQGGAIKTYSFDPTVGSVQVMLTTDGRPLNARLELLQGPNNNKQVVELYTEDGLDRPFYAVIETPGVGNVVRIVNTAPVEFPMYARIEPYMIVEDEGLDGGWDSMSLYGRR